MPIDLLWLQKSAEALMQASLEQLLLIHHCRSIHTDSRDEANALS